MCDVGTPVRQRAMCGCYRRRSVIAVAVAGLVVAGCMWDATAMLIGAVVAAVVVVAFCAHRMRGSGGLWLVHRYQPPAAAVQAEPQAAEERPWYERAQVGSRDSG